MGKLTIFFLKGIDSILHGFEFMTFSADDNRILFVFRISYILNIDILLLQNLFQLCTLFGEDAIVVSQFLIIFLVLLIPEALLVQLMEALLQFLELALQLTDLFP